MAGGELLWGLLFGCIGIGYFVYGRRQRTLMPFLTGLALIAFPYFVDGALLTLLVGAVLVSLPFVVKV